jgi:hypothetical protein
LELSDLLFGSTRFIFLHNPVRVSFLEDFLHAIRTHDHVSFTKFSDFFILLAIFSKNIIGAKIYELGSKKRNIRANTYSLTFYRATNL